MFLTETAGAGLAREGGDACFVESMPAQSLARPDPTGADAAKNTKSAE